MQMAHQLAGECDIKFILVGVDTAALVNNSGKETVEEGGGGGGGHINLRG